NDRNRSNLEVLMKSNVLVSKLAILALLMLPAAAVAQMTTQQQGQTGQKPATVPPDIPQTAPQTDQSKADAAAKPSDKPIDTTNAKATGTGKEDDVNAIGNRNVGGRGLGDWYSTESEIKMGKQYAAQI